MRVGEGFAVVHSSKLKKATFALPESLLNRLRTLVETERVTSVNAVVREAVEKYVTDFERESFRKTDVSSVPFAS